MVQCSLFIAANYETKCHNGCHGQVYDCVTRYNAANYSVLLSFRCIYDQVGCNKNSCIKYLSISQFCLVYISNFTIFYLKLKVSCYIPQIITSHIKAMTKYSYFSSNIVKLTLYRKLKIVLNLILILTDFHSA